MRTVKLITWNPEDEVYEMVLGTLTATHISSYDISCTEDLHVGGTLWVGDASLDEDVVSALLNLSEADLERYITLHSAGNPSEGDNQTVRGEKSFLDHVELWDAFIDTYELGTGVLAGNLTVDAVIIPETTSSWLGNIVNPWGSVCTTCIRHTYRNNEQDMVEGPITVYATSLKPDPDATAPTLGDSEGPWEAAYIKSLQVTSSASFEEIKTLNNSFVADQSGITISKSLMPYNVGNIRLGDTDSYFSGVFTTHIDFGTGYIATDGGGLLSMQSSLRPTVNASYDLGTSSYKWRKIYTDNLQCTSSVTLMAHDNTREIIMDAISGNLTIEGFNLGYGLVLEPIQDPETFTYYSRTPITCGKLHGELVSPEYVPTADHMEFPGANEYTAPPLFGVEVGSIIMAIPCWATLRSVFGNPQPVGKIIDVVTPNDWETAQPFEHTNDYENDPEKGAWYYAIFKPGSDSNGASTYVPLHTLTQGGTSGTTNYAYLTMGKYKLLSCVSAYSGSYDDYVPNGYTGACVMLQRIS